MEKTRPKATKVTACSLIPLLLSTAFANQVVFTPELNLSPNALTQQATEKILFQKQIELEKLKRATFPEKPNQTKEHNNPNQGQREKIGGARSLLASSLQKPWTPQITINQLDNKNQDANSSSYHFADGLLVESTGASAISIGLEVHSIPQQAQIWLADGHGQILFGFSGKEILETIAKNIKMDGNNQQARTWWSPPILGEKAAIIIETPQNLAYLTSDLKVSVHNIMHYWEFSPFKIESGTSNSCTRSAICFPQYQSQRHSVAAMIFNDYESAYRCTGTLLNDRGNTGTPNFITANHCISQQSLASTLTTLWFAEAESCGSSRPQMYVRLDGGATLLWTQSNTDTSLLRLNKQPPKGVVFSGWTTHDQTGDSIIGIHHPRGDVKKISFGQRRSFAACHPISNTSFRCTPSNQDNAAFVYIEWQEGQTEPGSSGSGYWSYINGQHYFSGVLYGGAGSCSGQSSNAISIYGRFGKSYVDGMAAWLEKPGSGVPLDAYPTVTVHEFYNPSLDRYFRTADEGEANWLRSTPATGERETGNTFKAYKIDSAPPGSLDVCRFYGSVNPGPNSHFYTMSQDECNYLKGLQLQTPPNQKRWNYEGIAFKIFPVSYDVDQKPSCGENLVPVYRLYNKGFERGRDSNHRYTTNPQIYQDMQANGWVGEGIVMCAPR